MPANAAEAKLEHGIPLFLTQLVAALVRVKSSSALRLVGTVDSTRKINDSAALHGQELLKNGFTVSQVVHGYGDVCQIVTELAIESNAPIDADDFHVFNRCLDDAIAGAVTAYAQQREDDLAYEGTERRGLLAHEMRNLIHGATLSLDVIKRGSVGLGGSTGAMLSRCLSGISALVEGSLAEVRLETGTPKLTRILLSEFIEEVTVGASMQAEGNHLSLSVGIVPSELAVDCDRQLLTSALSNLLQNAFKFTRANGTVSLNTRATAERVMIDVSDECGGLPADRAEELFKPFKQANADRSGLGLGLTIAIRAVRANSGDITVRDVPGTGCVFTIDLPRQAPPGGTIFHVLPYAADQKVPAETGAGSETETTAREPKERAQA